VAAAVNALCCDDCLAALHMTALRTTHCQPLESSRGWQWVVRSAVICSAAASTLLGALVLLRLAKLLESVQYSCLVYFIPLTPAQQQHHLNFVC
jgi:hypothetical protein